MGERPTPACSPQSSSKKDVRAIRFAPTLVAIYGQQHAAGAPVRWLDCQDPLVTEVLSERPFFYGARGIYCKCAGQRVRLFRASGVDGSYVQNSHQPSVDADNRSAGTAQVHMSGSEVLAPVDDDSSLFGDAGANPVCALDLLEPDAPDPGSPEFELARPYHKIK